MPLSEHEQKLLEQLEKQLHEDDPKFASSMGSDPGRSWSTRHLVIGVLATLAGILLLLVGVSLSEHPCRGPRICRDGSRRLLRDHAQFRRGEGESGGHAKKSGKPRSSFMSNLEERWDERHRGEP